VEGTGSYGAGLARHLHAHSQVVVEVDRPDRAARRRQGKADTLGAHAAARAVQAGTATGTPKAADGQVEMLRSLRLARRSAVKARTQAANQLKALLVTAPDGLRARLRGLPLAELVTTAARLRPGQVPATPTAAAKFALRSVGGRQPPHHRQAAQVRPVGDRDDPRQAQWPERVVQPRRRGLRGVALAPVLASQPPGHLDVVGVGLLVVQAAHPQERAVLAAFDGEQTQPSRP